MTLLERMRTELVTQEEIQEWYKEQKSIESRELDDIILSLVFSAGEGSMLEKTEDIVKKSFVK